MPTARVASVHDFADGEMRAVTVGGTEVLLTRVDGAFHACGARCTHYGAPLADGVLHGCIVTCPWHHAQFDVTTGVLDAPPALDALVRYEVFTEGRDVFVRVPDDAEETPEGASVRESGGHAPAFARRDEADDRTFVIVGGGAAGEAAAEALREFGYTGRVILVTQEAASPYDRTKLSKAFLSGDADSDALPLRNDDFYDRHDIEVRRGATVTLLDASIEAVEKEGDGLRVTLGSGNAVAGDLVLVGIGVTPATDFLDGVTTHPDGGVIVDTHLAAGSGLWAAGDIAHFPELRSGERIRIEHWRLAQQHGRVAARNMAGEAVAYRGLPFFWSGQFGVSLRYVGHAKAWDEAILDGDLENKQFIAYYVQGDTVRAAAGVGRDKEMAALHALMLDDNAPSADEVRSGLDLLARLK